MSAKAKLFSERKYSQQMKQSHYLNCLDNGERELLLHELYRIASQKNRFENWSESERDDAVDLQTWRQFLKKAQPRLHAALDGLVAVADLATMLPKKSKVVLYFDAEQFRQQVLKAAKRLANSIDLAKKLEPTVAALINPKLRTKKEKKLAQTELVDRYKFSVGTKSSFLDHWFILTAASLLHEFGAAVDKKIPRPDYIIAELFKAAFSQHRTPESVRVVLRRKLNSLQSEPKAAPIARYDEGAISPSQRRLKL